MKICFVSTIGYPTRTKLGGVPICTRNMALALASHGHEVSVVTVRSNGAPFQEEDGPVTVYNLSLGNLHYYFAKGGSRLGMWPRVVKAAEWGYGVSRFVQRLYSRGKADVTVLSKFWIDSLWHPKHMPYVVRIDTPLFAARPVPGCGNRSGWATFERLEQRTVRRANAVICLTNSDAKQVQSEYKITGQKTVVIPNPIDTNCFQPIQREAGRRPRIFHPGPRLNDWQKGTHVLLEAMEQVLLEFPDAELFLAGRDAPTFENRSERVKGATRLLGWLDSESLTRQYAMADITVVPSLNYEAFSLVCAESLAAGTPVIGTSVGGIPDVVKHMETGLIVPPGDATAVARAISRLISDVPLLTGMRQRACQMAEEEYSLESVGKKMWLLCDRLVRSQAISAWTSAK